MLKSSTPTAKNVRADGQIMEINVNSSSVEGLLARVKSFISDSANTDDRRHKFYIVTPNSELVLMAQDNLNLKKALNSADISIPDSVGLKIADMSLNIIKGREFFMDLIRLAHENNWSVFLLGGMDNEAKLSAEKLKKEYSVLRVESHPGPMLDGDARPKTTEDKIIEKEVVDRINNIKPQLLFVAFGNPKQEIWIHNNLARLNIGGAMAIGGTLRYIAGVSKLPPAWIEKMGLEWFWRLVTEPKRLGRIIRAVVVFPIRYLFFKLSR